MAEIKELTDKIQGAVDYMHKAADTQTEEAKKFGVATAETKSVLDKVNKHIDELEIKLQRQSLVSPGSGISQMSEEQKARLNAFFKWLRNGKANMEPQERKSLVEDATGLVLVPEDLEADIIRGLPALTPMRGLCMTRQTTRDKIRARSMTEVSVGWGKLETGAAITETTLVPSDGYIYVEDLYGLTKVGEDELKDTDVNLQSYIADSFRVAIATAENTAFVIGSGHSTSQPAGIAVDTTLLTGIGSGAGAGASGTYGNNWTTDDAVILDDILECEYSLPAQYLSGASWLLNRKTELAMRVLKAATTGTYLWQPSLQVGMPNNFDGFPIYNSADMSYPADTLAKTNVIFGNFRQGYLILDRAGITLQRLDELYAESGLVGFKVHFRVGGGLIRRDTFQVISNDT